MSTNVIEASGLGKRYGRTWALHECTLAIPAGHVAALVGPNGAGKTTLLNLAVGLAAPSAGGVTVLGGRPAGSPAALDGIAFVAQDTPLYKNLSAADMIYVTRSLNRRFDQPYAKARLDELGIPPKRKAGKLSGGQQAQLALTLALARHPRLLVLDEPVAMLDPIARHDFMDTVLAAAAADGVSVLLSSHALAELERVAGYLILLSRGRVRLAGEIDDLLASHGRASLEELALAYLRDNHIGGGAMTAQTMPARPAEDASLRPVPWRRMAGVTWRQHRFALAGVAALLGAVAVYLWLTGLQMHHAYATATACHPASSVACLNAMLDFSGSVLPHWRNRVPAAGGARADRGVRRGTGAWPGAGDRYLPVRVDPGLRPMALDARQAGAARGRGDGLRRGVQPAGLLVLPAALRRTLVPSSHVRFQAVRTARGGVRRLDAGGLRHRRPGRHAHPPRRPRDRRHPGRLRWAHPRGWPVPAPALRGAAGHRGTCTCPVPRGS